MSEIYDATPCALGEGPLWHPERGQLYWFDILKRRLLTREAGETRTWTFDGHVSAAGWIDARRLLVASERALFAFDLETGTAEDVAALEADRPDTRSNDGRADPFGGFWIGTMSKAAETGQGSIYRFFRGELRLLRRGITIPNAICFSPDGGLAFFADTRARKIWRQRLSDRDGWPEGDAEVFVDLGDEGLHPDGAVIDADGNLWNAQWGAARVAVYRPDGAFERAVAFDAAHTSCPAFGGEDFADLYCTSARADLPAEALADGRAHGATFREAGAGRGQAEHRVIL